jgi:hypothetical protein
LESEDDVLWGAKVLQFLGAHTEIVAAGLEIAVWAKIDLSPY